MKAYAIASCPFCSGEAELKHSYIMSDDDTYLVTYFHVQCMKCGARSAESITKTTISDQGDASVIHDGADAAIKAWNRRADGFEEMLAEKMWGEQVKIANALCQIKGEEKDVD